MNPMKLKEIEELLDVQGRMKAAGADQERYAQDKQAADSRFQSQSAIARGADSIVKNKGMNPFVGAFQGARDFDPGMRIADLVQKQDVAPPVEQKQDILNQYRAAKMGQFSDDQKHGRDKELEAMKQGFQGMQAQQAAMRDAEKQELANIKEMQKRFVPGVGLALTEDDAKKIKDAAQIRDRFNSKIDELVNLRSEYGGEFVNREAVARGQSIANQLRADYKQLVQLGDLDKGIDEKTIDRIIPKDPLRFDMPWGTRTMTTLETLKEGMNQDLEGSILSRLDTPMNQGLGAEDQQAMEWAQNNPNDPRSMAIIQSLSKKSTALAR